MLGTMLAIDRTESTANLGIGARTVKQRFAKRSEIKARSTDEDRNSAARFDLNDLSGRISCPIGRSIVHIGIDVVDKMMRNASFFLFARFSRRYLNALVDLYRIAIDDLAAYAQCKFYAEYGLAGGRRARDRINRILAVSNCHRNTYNIIGLAEAGSSGQPSPGNMTIYEVNYILAAICLISAFACVFAEWRVLPKLRIVSKIAASSAFIALAAANGAFNSNYGCLILTALILSWAGDVMLLSLRSPLLLGGIAAFFFAHLAFAAAFAFLALNTAWFVVGLLVMTGVAALLLIWLWPHLLSSYRFAVPAYLVAIITMTSLAIGTVSAEGSWLLAIGAVTFAVSDISVARDRFVKRSIVNRAWGLPLYYGAQIIFAMSVLSHR